MAESTVAPVPSPLLGAAELRPLIGSRELLIVDCRHDLARPSWGAAAYAEAHLPGAVFAALDRDLSAPIRPGTGRHPLPDAGDFARTLGQWGLTAATRVVAYDHGPGPYAARLWWMLRAIGHRQVQVLDGGLAAWIAAGGNLTSALPSITPTTVPTREFAGVVNTAQLEQDLAARRVTLVDARGADRFAGQNETIDPVAGHVPGAVNHPYGGNLSEAQTFLPAAELARRWQQEVQAAGRAPIVAMCGSGVTACHNLLALELAGYGDGKLYAGSFSEWIADPRRPVATGMK
jgi:thiosulfate/3-mercaptopyruvate sulfurtransferase